MDYPWQQFAAIINRKMGSRLIFPNFITPHEKLCIACSGGMDSVFLALALAAKFPAQRLAILHYNHNTRGKESDGDEQFVADFSRALNLKFFTEKRQRGSISEDALRRVRYAFFSQIMAKWCSKCLFLAHHGDDAIETMLMRLARGSAEIAAPKHCQCFPDGTYRIRPLLPILKGEIADLFRQNQIPWREDSSNQGSDYLRNRIRQMIPSFDSVFEKRNWKEGFLLAHRYLEEDALCLNPMAEALCTDPNKLDLQKCAQSAIIRRAIQFWLRDLSLTRPCFDQIFDSVLQNHSAKISVDSKTFIRIEEKILHRIQRSSDVFKMDFKSWQFGVLYLPTGYKLTREIVPFPPQNMASEELNISLVYVDDKSCSRLSLRPRQPGDRYRPINGPTKSLKKLFSEKKIPPHQRRTLPMVCDEKGAILWVPHLPPADFVKVQNNFALKITFSST
ncbi:MAG: tRNA lysidine(34) synthetase TilS [Puniceicoccales bacterium]|jgi:tRNA(Ile)-lysidine synthase|nr:tRNA lysidine(34) synthetase TilS [Puniceicoccales bacterium]